MKLSDIIKQYREETGISMDQLALKSGLSKGYISMLENGVNPRNKKPISPTLPSLKKVAEGLGIELDDLLKLMDDNSEVVLDNTGSETADSSALINPEIGDTPKESSEIISFSAKEITMVEKYRDLDEYGKKTVDTVLDIESERCKDEKENTILLSEEELRQLPLAERIEAIKAQGIGGLRLVARNRKHV